jgi:lipoprotein-anchoring transpeptidase ErfK/SrfK
VTVERLRIEVDAARQSLSLVDGESGRSLAAWPVSTARNGLGERHGSNCTPRGRHRILVKIGAGCPTGTVFVGRRPTGEIYNPALARQAPGRDWILTRILWLGGCEPGFNRGRDCDTGRRYIYIHGTPDTEPMGRPLSHGCIRMRNADVIALFDRVDTGTPVWIRDGGAG